MYFAGSIGSTSAAAAGKWPRPLARRCNSGAAWHAPRLSENYFNKGLLVDLVFPKTKTETLRLALRSGCDEMPASSRSSAGRRSHRASLSTWRNGDRLSTQPVAAPSRDGGKITCSTAATAFGRRIGIQRPGPTTVRTRGVAQRRDNDLRVDVAEPRQLYGPLTPSPSSSRRTFRRRHLTGEQKRDWFAKLLKANSERSDRSTAKIAHGARDRLVRRLCHAISAMRVHGGNLPTGLRSERTRGDRVMADLRDLRRRAV